MLKQQHDFDNIDMTVCSSSVFEGHTIIYSRFVGGYKFYCYICRQNNKLIELSYE
jgi:hypothetical protein